MNSTLRLRIALIVALVIAVGWLVVPKLSALRSTADEGNSVPVLVAARYIPALTAVKKSYVRVQEFPKALVPPGALRIEDELTNDNEQLLFTSAIAIPENHPITRAFLVDSGQSDSLTASIRPGKVAVSFDVDRAHGVGGWLKPGDTVAMFRAVIPDAAGRTRISATQLLLPSVTILAVDGVRLGQGRPNPPDSTDTMPAPEDPSGSHVITVLASPTDAASIVEAREHGNLSLVLRAAGDDYPWPE